MNKDIEKILHSQKCKCGKATKVTNKKSFKVDGINITKFELTCPDGHKNFLELKI